MIKGRIAIIDLGTNTFNLLIAEREGENLTTIYQEKDGVAIGLGGINQGILTEDAMDRGLKTLKKFKSICDEHECQQLWAYGTSAIRNASNKSDFVAKVKDEVGIEIEIIDGQKEAELIFEGVSHGLHIEGNYLIMDIGGGSTEFIYANKNGVIKSGSFEIGVSRIYQFFNFSDPYRQKEREAIYQYIEMKVGDFFEGMEVDVLVGASGSFETFYELNKQTEFPGECVSLSKLEMLSVLDKIIRSTQVERDANPFIIPIRKKMAPIAALKVRWIVRNLNIEKIMISPYSLKEGALKRMSDV